VTLRVHQAGGRFEEAASYARAKRVGPFVYVAGTTAIEATGKIHAPGDTGAQTVFVLNRIEEFLRAVGAERRHVVRVRCYLTDLSQASGFVAAHGVFFRGITPVLTAVEAKLTQPGLMIEIDVDAIIHDENGTISL
jgi:enamine deaminase RidA (YjgF/YER057c/UK114 family)